MRKPERIEEVMQRLARRYGERKSMLGSMQRDPFRVLVSTMLSARTRDENTALVAKRLFARYPDAQALASAPIADLEDVIRSTGFYHAKARHVKAAAHMLLDDFGGVVPHNIDSLLALPGVGRKTANCLLVYGYGTPAVAVDTHVHRIANRLGWIQTKTPTESEKALVETVPKKWWLSINEYFVLYGKEICNPIRPRCPACVIGDLCPYPDKTRR